jgi:hypothetical protein
VIVDGGGGHFHAIGIAALALCLCSFLLRFGFFLDAGVFSHAPGSGYRLVAFFPLLQELPLVVFAEPWQGGGGGRRR